MPDKCCSRLRAVRSAASIGCARPATYSTRCPAPAGGAVGQRKLHVQVGIEAPEHVRGNLAAAHHQRLARHHRRPALGSRGYDGGAGHVAQSQVLLQGGFDHAPGGEWNHLSAVLFNR